MNQPDTPPAITPDDDEIDLFELWDTIVQGKWLVIAVTALCLGAATTLAFIMTPKYEAKVIASFADEGKSAGGLSALAGQFGGLAEMAGVNLGGGSSSRESALAYLKSHVFLESFIEENGLMQVFYAKQWDAANKKWLTDDPEKVPTLWKAYNLFTSILDVQSDKKTNLVTLTITWKDRQQAVTWANELIRRANATLRQKAITETQQSISYLEKELSKTSVVEVQNTIYRVMETQIKTMMMANTQEQLAFKVIDPAGLMDKGAFVKPKRLMMIALGAIGGLFAGVLLVFLRQALRNRKQRPVA